MKTTSLTARQGRQSLTKSSVVIALLGILASGLAATVNDFGNLSGLVDTIGGFDKLNGLTNDLQSQYFGGPQQSAADVRADAGAPGELKAALDLYLASRYGQAMAKAQAILVAAPTSSIAHELIGASQLKLGDFDKGINSLLLASRLGPERSSPVLGIADAYLTRGDLAQAREYYQRVLGKKSDQWQGHAGLGLVSEREGKLDHAVTHFEAALVGMPPTPLGIRLNLSAIYNRQGQFEKTISLLRDLVGTKPANESAIGILGIAYLGVGKPTKAIQTFQLVSASSPTAPVALGLGISYRLNNQLPESLKYLKQASSLRDNWDVAWRHLAETQIASSDLPGALASLNKARSLAPELSAIDVRIGYVYLRLKDYPKAIDIFARLAAAKEGDLAIRDQLGAAYQAKGDAAAAEQNFRASAKRFPNEALPLYRLGLLYHQGRRYPEAIAELDKAAALDPKNSSIQRALSMSCHQAGQTRRAIEIAESLVQSQPGATESKMFLAALYGQADDDKRASSIYRDVLKTNPDHVIALNNLAMALARSGNFEEAIQLARHAVSLLPQSGQLLDSLGWITYLQGEITSAAGILQKSAELSPKDPSIQFHLGMAYWRQSQKAKALDSFQRATNLSDDFPERKQTTEMLELAGKELK